MKNKLIDDSASIFSLKNFTYDLYLYFCFWSAAEFIAQSNDFIFTGFIWRLRKLIFKKLNWKITLNYNKKTHLCRIKNLLHITPLSLSLSIYIYIYIYIYRCRIFQGAPGPACPLPSAPNLMAIFNWPLDSIDFISYSLLYFISFLYSFENYSKLGVGLMKIMKLELIFLL